MCVVARPPVAPCWGHLLVIPIRGVSMLFGGLFFSSCHPACRAGESAECRGACVCGCRDAATSTVRAPPLFFRNANAWSGIGGSVAVRLAEAPQWKQQPLQPHCWMCAKGSMVKTGQPRHAAATHSFDDTLTSNARFLFDRSRSQLADDPATPPPIASTETMRYP